MRPRLPSGFLRRPTAWLLYFLEDQGSDAHLPIFGPGRGGRRKHYLVAVPFDFPAQGRACEYLVPGDIDVMLDGLPVKCVAPAIRRHRAEQVSALLIGHLLEAFRFWSLAPNQKYEHAAVLAVSNVARFVGVFFFLAGLQYSCRGADEPVSPLQLRKRRGCNKGQQGREREPDFAHDVL